jgi:hypothetical protein
MMRPLGLGLAAALFVAALTSASTSFARLDSTPAGDPTAMEKMKNDSSDVGPAAPINADQRAQGMKEAPPLVTAAKLPCTLADAQYVGSGVGPDKIHAKYYEVACKEGLGFMIIAKDKVPEPTVFDCIIAGSPGPDGKPSTFSCKLPGNRHPGAGLQPMITKSGRDCAIAKTRYVGSTPQENIYEVSCTQGGGYLLEDSRDYSGAVVKATNCVDYDPAGNIKCTLITRPEQYAAVDKLVAASGKPCAIKDRRYVGSTSDGSDYYEFACNDGSGFMLKASLGGQFEEAVECGKAGGIAGGCTLSDARQAETAQAGLYTSLAKKAGFDCNVTKYADFPTADNAMEIVELACSNRPDGGVGFFPGASAAKAQVLDCLRSEAEGYRCSFTPTSALYPKLSAQLKAKNRGSCVVSDARAFAFATAADGKNKDDLVEVACADGGPGLVLDYDYGVTEPVDLKNCAQVASNAGGCQLPGNKRKS